MKRSSWCGASPRLFGAQASGCAPIVSMVHDGRDEARPVMPDTIARSIAIGNPADGRFARRAIVGSGGWAAAVSDTDIVRAIHVLAEDTGVFTETAGGATVGAALAHCRARRFSRRDEIVLCITGNGLKTLDPIRPHAGAQPPVSERDCARCARSSKPAR